MPVSRFNMAEITRSLERTQAQFAEIDKSLNVRHPPLMNEMVENMVAGYRFIDHLLATGTDLFAMGNSQLLLEINTLVLCGADAKTRDNYLLHIERNRQQFYDDDNGGIGSLMEWLEFHRRDDLWKKAAGLYIQVTSQPQLFIEGNHRSAILMVSFMLGREGFPPFVLTCDNAKELLDQSRQISELKKHHLTALVQTPRLRRRLEATLKNSVSPLHALSA